MNEMNLISFLVGFLLVSVNCRSLSRINQHLKDLADRVAVDVAELRNALETVHEIIGDDTTLNSIDTNTGHLSTVSVDINNSSELQRLLFGRMDNLERAFLHEKQYLRQTLDTHMLSRSDVEAIVQVRIGKDVDSLKNSLRDLIQRIESNVEHINEHGESVEDMEKDVQKLKQIQGDNQRQIGELIKRINEVTFAAKISGWRCLQESCYFIHAGQGVTWIEAKTSCEKIGAILAEVDTEAENTFLVDLAKSQPDNRDNGFYLGSTDEAEEGVWIWTNSGRTTTETFDNFKRRPEPNGGRRENCLHLYRQYNWKWNDTRCNNKMGYICEVRTIDIQ
ncbi:hypothetical protein ACF0H5_020927 [Mactra antiquata]